MEEKILLIIGHSRFDDDQYKLVRGILASQGFPTETASTHLSAAQGTYGLDVMPDVLINYVESGDYRAFVFIGGEGASEYYSNSDVLRIINQAHLTGKLLAAIGSAVPTLTYSGKLANALVSGDESDKTRLEELGAYYSPNPVTETGDFITANPTASQEFTEKIIEALSK